MGLHVHNSGINTMLNSPGKAGEYLSTTDRRRSVGFLSVEDRYLRDGTPKLDHGRDSGVDPSDISEIIRRKQKEMILSYR